jgi:phosphoglycerol transferase
VTDIFIKPDVKLDSQTTVPAIRLGVPAVLALVAITTAWFLMGGTSLNLQVPLIYSGDGLLILVMIKRVMEGTWLFHSNLMGAPFGSYLYDYPIPDSGSLFVLKWLGRLFGSPAKALNLYFLLGFPVNALAAYIVLRKLRVSIMLCFAGGFIFTLLPFHFERLGHLFYTWYFAAPIFVWYALKIFRGEYATGKKTSDKLKAHCKHALVLLILSCFGVYYSFFGILTLATAGMMRCLGTRSIRDLRCAVVAIAIIGLGTILNISPNLLDRFQHGVNHETAARSPVEAEIYGLKTIQLVLPRVDHRIKALAKVTAKYSTTFPLVNENSTASLGLIGSVGFIALLFSLIVPRRQRDERFFVLAAVTFALLLFCSIGGFSALFAVLITPMIRAWNRVSVFIAFTSIAGTLLMIDQFLGRVRAKRHVTRWAGLAAGMLCIFAYWDQTTPACTPCLRAADGDFKSDASFVAAIEKTVPKNSAIYQLPYLAFPEVPPINKLGAYDPARGYLDSQTLRWSWGAMKGRPADLFFRSLATESPERQIEVARRLCFSGVYIDRRGYADNGAAIEASFQQALGRPPTLTSSNNQEVFFDLANQAGSACALPSGITQQQIMERAGLIVDEDGVKYPATLLDGITFARAGTPTFLKSLGGMSGAETWGRWSDAAVGPVVSLRFAHPLPAHFVLHLRAQGFGPNAGLPAKVVVGTEVRNFIPTGNASDFILSFSPPTGTDLITIQPAQPISPTDLGQSADGRKLGLGIQRLWIETPQ